MENFETVVGTLIQYFSDGDTFNHVFNVHTCLVSTHVKIRSKKVETKKTLSIAQK